MNTVRIGVIGVGNMGSAHGTNIVGGRCPDFELRAVADVNPARLEWAREHLGAVECFDDAIAMLDSGKIDACMVCVPHYDHAKYAMECMKRGIHVMVEKPAGVYTKQVREMNAEADRHPQRTLSEIRRLGMKAGLAFNPGTDIASLRWLAPDLDMVLVMSVNPGFSGQKFIPQSFDKIRATRAMLNAAGAGDVLIQVDGGACPENTAQLVAAGADVLVSGSAFFGHPPYDQCHQKFQAAAQAAADNAHNARCAAAALWQPGRALKK